MPIIKSAKKRVRQTTKAKSRNDVTRKNLRLAIKNLQASFSSKKGASQSLAAAQSSIDQAVKKGLMHKNKAARKKSQLAAAAKAAGVKLEKSAAPKAKSAVKRSSVAPKATIGKVVAKKK
jgi:ribosomal protein S20